MIPHCDFNLHFLNLCAYWPFIGLLSGNVYSRLLFVFNWVVWFGGGIAIFKSQVFLMSSKV